MARPLRIEFPGAVYHLTARGNRRENIFFSDEDREGFLQILDRTVSRYKWICHAYCLMDNHYHLLIETPGANLSQGMRQLNGIYTQFANRRHQKTGHIFQGRFTSILVERDAHLLELCRYIVNNPVKAGRCKAPGDWPWSSYGPTAIGQSVPQFLTVDWILAQFSRQKEQARKKYRAFVLEGLVHAASPWEKVVGQVIFGSERFVEELRPYLAGDQHIGEIPRIQRVAGRPVLPELFSSAERVDKTRRNKKIALAHLEFRYTLKEIADHLGIHYTTVSRVIARHLHG